MCKVYRLLTGPSLFGVTSVFFAKHFNLQHLFGKKKKKKYLCFSLVACEILPEPAFLGKTPEAKQEWVRRQSLSIQHGHEIERWAGAGGRPEGR